MSPSPATLQPAETSIARRRMAEVYVYTQRTAKVIMSRVTYPVQVDRPEELMSAVAGVLAEVSRGAARKWVPARIYDGREEPACYWMLANHESRMIPDKAYTEPDTERRDWQTFLADLPENQEHYLAQESQDDTENSQDLEDELAPGEWEEQEAAQAAPEEERAWESLAPAVTPREVDQPVEQERATMVAPREAEPMTAPAPAPYTPGEHFQMESLMMAGKHSTAASMGVRGLLNRTGLVALEPSAHEKDWRAAKGTMAQPWEGLRVAAVVNEKGGAGKSPMAAMLAAAYARETPFSVHLFDNNESAGNIRTRLSVTGAHTYTAKDLAAAYKARGGLTRSQMESFLHFHEADRYALLAAHRPRHRGDTLSPEEVHNVYLAQEEHVSLSITDSGNTITSPNWEQMVLECDQLVVPVMTSPDRDQGAVTTLGTLETWGEEYPAFKERALGAVILVSQWRPGDDTKEYVKRWKEKVPESNVIVIPYDAHLGSHDLRFTQLRPRTQLAFMKAAAAVRRGWAE